MGKLPVEGIAKDQQYCPSSSSTLSSSTSSSALLPSPLMMAVKGRALGLATCRKAEPMAVAAELKGVGLPPGDSAAAKGGGEHCGQVLMDVGEGDNHNTEQSTWAASWCESQLWSNLIMLLMWEEVCVQLLT